MDERRYQEILSFALKNERDAAAMYTKYVGVVKSSAAKELLREMARTEEGHERMLQQILQRHGSSFPQGGESQDLRISDYLVDVSLKDDSPIEDVFVFAMKCEESARRLYENLAAAQTDPESRKLFEQLAAAEKKHKFDLESEYDSEVLEWN